MEYNYNNSWALIIGINDYTSVSPLDYARNDAEAISEILIKNFQFPADNIISLYDAEATRENIIKNYLSFAQRANNKNDRLLVFYAGHGHTEEGHRGEIGYLIPHDAKIGELATYIRWDEFTRNADLLAAKHILFIMDACYGGLALMRSTSGGSRFVKDMLKRRSRQVLTAGKADQVVADAGGPIPEHSIFTGHLIQALEGKAASPTDGTITAQGVMAYVYDKVAKDINSNQTPHFGHVDGDGDFIFSSPILTDSPGNDLKEDSDYMIELPTSGYIEKGYTGSKDIAELVKEYIPDKNCRIKLYDLFLLETKHVISCLNEENFPSQVDMGDAFLARLKDYEKLMKNLVHCSTVLCYWGEKEHLHVLRKTVSILAHHIGEPTSGYSSSIALKRYPLVYLAYHAGIASIASERYSFLNCLLTTKFSSGFGEGNISEVIKSFHCKLSNAFKKLPGFEKLYVPRSEYIYKAIQPDLDDILFLGKEYDNCFDRFEIFLGFISSQGKENFWGPAGRYCWKYPDHSDILDNLAAEISTQGDDWPPLKAGLFDGSPEKAIELVEGCKNFIPKLNFF